MNMVGCTSKVLGRTKSQKRKIIELVGVSDSQSVHNVTKKLHLESDQGRYQHSQSLASVEAVGGGGEYVVLKLINVKSYERGGKQV